MLHSQDCSEAVWIESIVGNLEDLVGTPILFSEEISNIDRGELPNSDNSYTWTFYKIGTLLGGVTIRWYGTSNGYYSESVDFIEKNEDGNFSHW